MTSSHVMKFMMGLYLFIFFTYLFGPLIIMSFTAFNSAEFPAITPWECFTFRWFNEGKIAYDGQHLAGLFTDWRLHDGLISSLIIGGGVVLLAVPIGMAAAIVLTQVKSQLRDIYYSISIMPVLFPGVIIGISTVVLWDRLAGLGGEGRRGRGAAAGDLQHADARRPERLPKRRGPARLDGQRRRVRRGHEEAPARQRGRDHRARARDDGDGALAAGHEGGDAGVDVRHLLRHGDDVPLVVVVAWKGDGRRARPQRRGVVRLLLGRRGAAPRDAGRARGRG